jgi:hypothetical protein
MDLSKVTLAKSDQLNADDLLTGPQTFTVAEVREGSDEQPVSIVLAEWPRNRPFKPSKTVLRLLRYCLGDETDDWPPNVRMTLFRDADVKWAGEKIGGIRVSHLSHIDGPQKVALQESKNKKSLHTILPLVDAPAALAPVEPTAEEVAACTNLEELREMWKRSGPVRREQITARKADLENEPQP